MSKVCQLCDKGPSTGHNISHSMRHTKRRFLPNLFSKLIGGQRMKVCTRCLRTTSKVRV